MRIHVFIVAVLSQTLFSMAYTDAPNQFGADSRQTQISFQEVLTLQAEGTQLSLVNWSSTGRFIASAESTDGSVTIKIWESSTGRFLDNFTPEEKYNAVTNLEWSEDDSFLAVSYDIFSEGIIHILSVTSDSMSFHSELLHESENYDYSWIGALAWNPEDIQLISSGGESVGAAHARDETRDVYLWDIEDRRLLIAFPEEANRTVALSWSPDGQTIVTSDWEANIKLWDTSSITLLGSYPGYGADWSLDVLPTYRYLRWSPDSQRIAGTSCDFDCTIWIMNAESGDITKLIETEAEHQIYDMKWHPNMDIIAYTGSNNTVVFLDVETEVELARIPFESNVVSIDWSPSGEYLVTGTTGGLIKIFEILQD